MENENNEYDKKFDGLRMKHAIADIENILDMLTFVVHRDVSEVDPVIAGQIEIVTASLEYVRNSIRDAYVGWDE